MGLIKAWLLGAREFRLSFTTVMDTDREDTAYNRGREFMHWITFRQYED